MSPHEIAYLALGSNIGDKRHFIRSAILRLGNLDGLDVLQCSSIYTTKPMSNAPQDFYLNAVLKVATYLSPLHLLETCLAVEAYFGRERTVKWASRTIDIDLLLYGDESIQTVNLTVPHPRMSQRDFVLVPLRDLAGGSFEVEGVAIDVLLDNIKECYVMNKIRLESEADLV